MPYNVDPERVRLMPGAVEGLRRMRAAGYRLIVVSNQSGVARGYFAEEALAGVERRVRELLTAGGVPLDGFYYCPHHPQGTVTAYGVTCDCRKPAPGMIRRAAAEHGIDLERSWLVGDILHDVEAGRRAGCRTVLLLNGHETEWVLTPRRRPHYVAADLAQAADIRVDGGIQVATWSGLVSRCQALRRDPEAVYCGAAMGSAPNPHHRGHS